MNILTPKQIAAAEYYLQNKEKKALEYQNNKEKKALEYQSNKEKLKLKQKNYYNANKEKNKLYRQENKQKILNYRLKNKEKLTETYKKYYLKNKDAINKKHKIYMQKNRERTNELVLQRMKTDVQFKLKHILRNRLRRALKLKNLNNKQEAIKYLGCTVEHLKQYLENQFDSQMNWENHGTYGWHIDHVLPLSNFDLTKEKDLKIVCHYTNLQPLWAKDNLTKGNKII